MKNVHLLGTGFTLAIVLSVAPAAAQTVRATFAGYKGDVKIWTDVVTMEGKTKIEDVVEGEAKMPNREAVRYRDAESGELYAETVNGLPGYRVVVKDGYVYVYEGQGMAGMVMLEDPPVVFDPDYPSHYGVVLGMYREAAGGSQKIPVVIPAKGDYCKVEITRKAPASIPMGETSLSANTYEFRIGFKQTATVWTIGDAVAAVYLPSKDEDMVDTKYAMLHEKIRMIVKRAL
jgi:hypothetical protein